MKKNYFLLPLLFAGLASAQLNFTALEIKSTDMLYDKITDRIYVAISGANGANGNSIGIINPRTRVLESTTYIGSEPSVLAISDDSKYIYVGFTGTGTVRRYNVQTKAAEIQFSMGNNNSGSLYAKDIRVMPGTNSTIAVSKMQTGTSAPFKGVAIYDNGVQRPVTTFNPNDFTYDSADKIVFPTSSTIYGLSTSFSSSQPFRTIAVSATGAVDTNTNIYGLTNTASDIEFFENKIYATNGQVVDNLGPNAFVSGTYNSVNGPFSINAENRIISFVINYPYSFKRFNLDNFTLIDTTTIQDSDNKLANISCGSGCYAFNTANKIYFSQDPSLATNNVVKNNSLSIYPNPVKDVVNIKTESNITVVNAQLIDVSGKIIFNSNISEGKLDLSGVEKGIYFLKATDKYGKIHNTKLIKN